MSGDADQARVAQHEHEWHLDGVDFEDGGSVASYLCAGCAGIEFRAR